MGDNILTPAPLSQISNGEMARFGVLVPSSSVFGGDFFSSNLSQIGESFCR